VESAAPVVVGSVRCQTQPLALNQLISKQMAAYHKIYFVTWGYPNLAYGANLSGSGTVVPKFPCLVTCAVNSQKIRGFKSFSAVCK